MNLHKHIIERLAQILIEIYRDSAYADKIISRELKANKKWGSRDRRFFAEQVYDCVRWWRKYWFILDGRDMGSILGTQDSVTRYGDLRIPEVMELWAIHWSLKGNEVPNWPELGGFQLNQQRVLAAENNPAIRESVPDWLYDLGKKELGAAWDTQLKALNQSSTVDLRVNALKAEVEVVQKSLAEENVIADKIADRPHGLVLRERKNVFITQAFQNGWFEVQDRASQLVAPFLKIEPGMRVADTCAGAGGKSLHLAALLKNKGKLVSMDIHEWKLKELKERSRRNGVDVIETKVIDGTKTIKRMDKSFDRVLLDVPCSGLGVLRRNPDTKWKLSPESFAELKTLQAQILQDYSRLTKVGGLMVYATCSLMPSENEEQVESFLKSNPNFALEEMLRINPDQGQGDGFFAARMKRVSSDKMDVEVEHGKKD